MKEQFEKILSKPLGTLRKEEMDLIMYHAVHFPDGIKGALWGDIIMRAIEEDKTLKGANDAANLINKAYFEFDKVYPHLFEEKSSLLKKACLFCLEENNQANAHKHMETYIYNALAQVHYKAMNEKMPYYSFRRFSKYSLLDIENETISLAHPREFNDPLDTILLYWLDTEIRNSTEDDIRLRYRLLMKKVAEHIKIRCLIAGKEDDGRDVPIEELNVLMWAHYADCHKGFCVKYEFDSKLFESKTNNHKIRLVDKITYSDVIDLKDEPSIRKALLEKSDFWKYEREMRFLSFDCSEDDKEFPTIDCPEAAKAIYLGVKCSDADRRAMEKAIGDKNIPLYQMSVDETKLTRFKKTLIG